MSLIDCISIIAQYDFKTHAKCCSYSDTILWKSATAIQNNLNVAYEFFFQNMT